MRWPFRRRRRETGRIDDARQVRLSGDITGCDTVPRRDAGGTGKAHALPWHRRQSRRKCEAAAGDASRVVHARREGHGNAGVAGAGFHGLFAAPSDPLSYFASGHPATGGNLGFIASKDGGAKWEQVSPGADGPVDFHQLDVSAADPLVVYGVYRNVQRSADGGKNWSIEGRCATWADRHCGLVNRQQPALCGDGNRAAGERGWR